MRAAATRRSASAARTGAAACGRTAPRITSAARRTASAGTGTLDVVLVTWVRSACIPGLVRRFPKYHVANGPHDGEDKDNCDDDDSGANLLFQAFTSFDTVRFTNREYTIIAYFSCIGKRF